MLRRKLQCCNSKPFSGNMAFGGGGDLVFLVLNSKGGGKKEGL